MQICAGAIYWGMQQSFQSGMGKRVKFKIEIYCAKRKHINNQIYSRAKTILSKDFRSCHPYGQKIVASSGATDV